jgi:hypothetical protein
MFIGVLLLLPTICFAQVSFILNPGCSLTQCQQQGQPALYYGFQQFDNATVHIIYSSFDQLTISMFSTQRGETPTFNYTSLFARDYINGIRLDNMTVSNSFSVVLRRLLEFDDDSDSGRMDNTVNTTLAYRPIDMTRPTVEVHAAQPDFTLPIDQVSR